MTTALSTRILADTNRRTVIKIFGVGGGESNASLIVAANLAYALSKTGTILTPGDTANAKSQYRTSIKRIWGQGHGSTGKYVTLNWKNDANTIIAGFGPGQFDYNFDAEGLTCVITQPAVANTTGDILFTSSLNSSDAFTLFIDLKKDGRDFDQGQTADPTAFNKGL